MLLFQLLTVFPLLVFILRYQTFTLFSKGEYVGYKEIYLFNTTIIVICVLFAILMPSIGNIIRYAGAVSGGMVVFVLPSLVFVSSTKKEGKLTVFNVVTHLCIMCVGMANVAAQFSI